MGQGTAITSTAGAGGSNTTPPANVSAITVSGVIDPTSAQITLTVSVTPPGGGGTFAGCHLYLECPDQSNVTPMLLGTTVLGGAAVSGTWAPIDCGLQPYVASQQPWTVTIPGPAGVDPTLSTPCRIYASSFSIAVDNKLVQAGQPGATPNQTFTLISLASNVPTSGTNVTTLMGGSGSLIGITATVLSPVNVTGKLETPVLVDVTDTPANISGWVAQLVLTMAGLNPNNPANQQVIPGYILQAGPVYTTAVDGISVPHSFALDTPTAFTNATVWLQAGLVDGTGNYTWNNIVPGITPSFGITYGSTSGTTDATSVMTATIAASMAVVNGLFGVAPAGITNPLMGAGAVNTINIDALAITNPLLASLAVAAGNMQPSSVTAGNSAIAAAAVVAASLASSSVTATAIAVAAVGSAAIASLAVGTAAMQTAAVTNAIIANLAVSGAKIQSATITGANIASATIAGANIGTATITGANIASATITTAHIASATITGANIASATITDANIATLNVSKLQAGTAVFTGVATFASASGPSVTISSTGVTVNNGSNQLSLGASSVSLAGAGGSITLSGAGVASFSNGSTGSTINGNTITTGPLIASQVTISPGLLTFSGVSTFSSASGGSATLPANPVGFRLEEINGTIFKIPYYNV